MRKFIFFSFAVLLMLSILTVNTYAANVKVENVHIKKDNPAAWAVVGMIRNMGNRPVKGLVKIKYLNSSGDILKSHVAPVNEMDSLNPGQAGPFEFWDSPSEFNGVVDFQVIFKEK